MSLFYVSVLYIHEHSPEHICTWQGLVMADWLIWLRADFSVHKEEILEWEELFLQVHYWNTYLTETKKTMYGRIVFLPFILEMWPKGWVNAEGELQGQSCPRQQQSIQKFSSGFSFRFVFILKLSLCQNLFPHAYFSQTDRNTCTQNVIPAGFGFELWGVSFIVFILGCYLL